jgi:hypothetical protein
MFPVPHSAVIGAEHVPAVTGADTIVYLAIPLLWMIGVVLLIWHKLIWHKLRRG